MVRNKADEAVAKLPKAYGGDEPRLSRELNDVVDARRAVSSKDLRDDFLSVEHLLLAMNERLGVGSEELLQVLQEVRGSHRVTVAEPRGAVRRRSRSTARTSPPAPATARSTRSSAATTRSAASSRCSRGARRTTRC